MPSEVPISVWGRPKRQSTPRAPAAARGDARLTATGGRLIAQKLPAPANMRRQCWPPTAPPAPTRPSAIRAATTAPAWRGTSGASPSRGRGAVVIVIVAVCRDARRAGRGPWRRWRRIPAGRCARPRCRTRGARRAGSRCGAGDAVAADERSLRVDLGPDARLRGRRSTTALAWPRRAFGALGPAHAVPGPEPVLAPMAAARAGCSGGARVGDARRSTSTAPSPTPRRTGAPAACRRRGGGARPHGFDRDDVCVAFAGGRAGLGPLRAPATALVVAVGDEVRPSCGRCAPCASPSTSAAGACAGGGIEVEAHADGVAPHLLPVPVPPSAGAWTTGRPSTSRGRSA